MASSELFPYGNGGMGMRQAVRMSDLPTLKRFCKEMLDSKDAALLLEPAATYREWTSLHIAAWGQLKDPKKAKCGRRTRASRFCRRARRVASEPARRDERHWRDGIICGTSSPRRAACRPPPPLAGT